jgi:hypothetical protein
MRRGNGAPHDPLIGVVRKYKVESSCTIGCTPGQPCRSAEKSAAYADIRGNLNTYRRFFVIFENIYCAWIKIE